MKQFNLSIVVTIFLFNSHFKLLHIVKDDPDFLVGYVLTIYSLNHGALVTSAFYTLPKLDLGTLKFFIEYVILHLPKQVYKNAWASVI